MNARVLYASATLALLAGCATSAPPPMAAAAPAAASEAMPGSPTQYDGVYKSTSSNGIAKSRGGGGCNYSMSNLRVTNGNAAMNWREPMRGRVGPDGSLSMGGAANMLTGQISNGVFTGKLETPVCIYNVTLAR